MPDDEPNHTVGDLGSPTTDAESDRNALTPNEDEPVPDSRNRISEDTR